MSCQLHDHKFDSCPSPKLSNVQESRTQGLYEYRAKIKPGAARYDNFFMDSKRLQDARGGNAVGDGEGRYGGYVAAAWHRPESAGSEPYDASCYGSRERMSYQFHDHKFDSCPSPKLSNVQVSRTQGLHEYHTNIKPGAAFYDNLFIDSERLQDAREGNAVEDGGGRYGGYVAAAWHRPESAGSEPYDASCYGSRERMSYQFHGHVNACLLSFATTSLTHAPHRSSVTFRSHVLKGSMNIIRTSSQARHFTTICSLIRSGFKTHAKAMQSKTAEDGMVDMCIVLRSSQARHITTTSSRIRSVFKTHAKEI
eukprot:TRINITY_DN3065_c0_g1_i5.p1 TRINITY_DN3065_c0_g1~~TRINITY_DN3065_c0_g1_i5.p1  ORF type:complete len:310 (+),score=17.01 TRINITY_DN3065_c0_g1_i5:95-1024(+)